MKRFNAIALSPGIAIGKLKIIKADILEIKRKKIQRNKIEEEIKKFNEVIKKAIEELDYLIKEYSYSKENKDILVAHKMILKDEKINKEINSLIKEKLLSMEQAIATKYDQIISVFRSFEKKSLADRADDFEDVKNRLLTHILIDDKSFTEGIEPNTIIFAEKIYQR